VAVDSSLDLPPERTARAAAAEANAADWDTEICEERKRVVEGVGDAFEDGADEVGCRVGGRDAGEGSADLGVEVRGALAEQVGRPFEAVAARRDFGGGCGEGIVIFPAKKVSLSQRKLRPADWVTPMTCQRPGTAWQKVCRRPWGL
jgi:hypothetical protein